MFFSIFFKNKKGNKETVTAGLFNIAVIVNIVCLAVSMLLLLGCFFVNKSKVEYMIYAAILTLLGCYVAELSLAWASAMLNKDEEPNSKKIAKK